MRARLTLSFYLLVLIASASAWVAWLLHWWPLIWPVGVAGLLVVYSLILLKLFPRAAAWFQWSVAAIAVLALVGIAYFGYRQFSPAPPVAGLNPTTLFNLASLALSAKDTATARLDLDQALAQNANFVPALFLSGYLDYQNGDFAAAIRELSQVVTLTPNYSDARYFLGLSYHSAGRTSEAILQFIQLLKLNPGNQTIQKTLKLWSKPS